MAQIIKSICPSVFVPDIDTVKYPDIDPSKPVPFLYCNTVDIALAPEFSRAVLVRKYGLYGGGNMSQVDPLDLHEKAILIKYPKSMNPDDTPDTLLFAGVCVAHEDKVHADQIHPVTNANVPTGDTTYQIFSPDYLFDRIPIDETIFDSNKPVSFVYAFNGQNSDGELIGNRSPAEDDLSYYFQTVAADTWTLYDIVRYLVFRFATKSGFSEWAIVTPPGVADALSRAVFSYNPENKTLHQCLNELISPERGFAWNCTWNGDDAPSVYIYSITDTEITLDDTVYVPANVDTVDLSADISDDINAAHVSIRHPQEAMFSQIEIRGEPLRIMSTFKLGSTNGGMIARWPSQLETYYNAATDDAKRATENFEPVYQHFGFGSAWDGCNRLGNGLIPQWNPLTCAVTQWLTAAITQSFSYWTVDRNLPLPEANQPAAKLKTKYCKPVMFLQDGTKYYVSDKYRENEGIKIGLMPADAFPGVVLKSLYNHSMAKNSFTGASEYEAIYDYHDALVTASFATDEVLRYLIQPVYAAPLTYNKKLVIQIDGLHLWYGTPDTVVDVDSNNAPVTLFAKLTGGQYAQDASSYYLLRDDRPTLKAIAAFASAWYGRPRSIVNIEYQSFAPDKVEPGQILTSVYSGGAIEAAGTIVTNIAYNFINQKTSIGTDFPKINLRELATIRMRKTAAGTHRRLNALESALNDIPLREVSTGGATGSAYKGYFKIKDTSDTQYKISVVDGADSEATNCGFMFAFADIVYFSVASFTITNTNSMQFVFRKITQSNGEYTGQIVVLQALPAQIDGTYYSLIGRLFFQSGSLVIVPENFSNEVIGRTV